jgi:hypothetical protein
MPFIAYRYCWFFAGMVPLPNGKAGGNSGHATKKGCKLYRTHLFMWSAITPSCKWEPLFSAGFGGGTAFESSFGALKAETICVKFTPVTGTQRYLVSSVVDPWHFRTDPDQRIRASDQWIRIRILLFSCLTFKTPTKNYFYIWVFCLLLLKVNLHHFSKIKSHKEVTVWW